MYDGNERTSPSQSVLLQDVRTLETHRRVSEGRDVAPSQLQNLRRR